MSRVRGAIANIALLLGALTIGYLGASVILFRFGLPYLPPELRYFLPEVAKVLTQPSKASLQPHNYIALLGDSYAEGVGDWMLAPDPDPHHAPNTAGVIHEATGVDVVSFGRAGAGSAEALTQQPAHVFATRHCPLFPSLEEPAYFVIYFYEGNDLLDNIGLFWGLGGQTAHVDADFLDQFLATHYGAEADQRCLGQLFGLTLRVARSLGAPATILARFPPDRNAFMMSGKPVSAPGLLQGPSLELSEQEMRDAAVVFDRSLMWLRQRFPHSRVAIVYVPAPLTVYEPATNVVSSVSYTGSARNFPSEFVNHHSDFGCRLVRDSALGRGAAFLDARATLRAAAAARFIHGPRDWNHLNKDGYEALGGFVADYIRRQSQESMSCSQ